MIRGASCPVRISRSLAISGCATGESYLRDTLAVLPAVENGPGNAAGVLALEEEGLGFAVLESEDLVVATDVEFTLQQRKPVS